MTTPTAITEALAELELYAADVPGADDVIELARVILDQQDSAHCTYSRGLF